MFVYEVQPGDTLGTIATRYGLSVSQLRNLNSLVATDLVPGQALLVPSDRYQIQPGESLWTVQEKTGVPWQVIAQANGVTANTVLSVGRTLYIPPPPRPQTEVMGYLPLTDPGVTATDIRPWADRLTFVAMFSYLVDAQGNVTPIDDADAIAETRRIGASPLLCIANMRPGGVFGPDIARVILTDATVRRRMIDEIMGYVEARGYDGVDSDLEAIPGDLRDAYSNFLRELKARLGRRLLTVATPPKYNEAAFAYAAGHDYLQIGQIADRVFLMNYEFHWAGGPAGPISPLPEVERVLMYATSLMPRDKILNGILTTGYDWPVPQTPGAMARPLPHIDAVTLAQTSQVPILFDAAADTPWFRYRDSAGEPREVWFEDARSLLDKLTFVRDIGVRGSGIWQLGAFSPQLPPLLRYLFSPSS